MILGLTVAVVVVGEAVAVVVAALVVPMRGKKWAKKSFLRLLVCIALVAR